MTKVITRYFADASAAYEARKELMRVWRVSQWIIHIHEGTDDLVDRLSAYGVEAKSAKAYAKKADKGGAVMLVEAGHKPLGVARITRDVTAAYGAADMGAISEEVIVPDGRDPLLSVMPGSPLMLSRPIDNNATDFHMANWPIPLTNRKPPFTGSIFQDHARMANWPIGLINRRRPYRGSLIGRNQYMANFPIGHIVPGHKYMAKFPFAHIVPGHKFMAKFPFGHIVPGHKFMAKFPFGHIVPGHRFMANWPFPHLINGKQGTNSLVPGHKYMAKFPFAHIVPGHKYMANIPFGHKVSHNRRYGRFPFGLLVPGHKFMAKFPFGHLVPGHKYMANFIFPHTKTAA